MSSAGMPDSNMNISPTRFYSLSEAQALVDVSAHDLLRLGYWLLNEEGASDEDHASR
jgi:hypothetical protein